jgi:hypothetical protein
MDARFCSEETVNVSDFAQRFRLEDAEVVASRESWVRGGDNAEFFFAFCFMEEQLVSLNAFYPMSNIDLHRAAGKGPFRFGPISLNRYTRTAQGFDIAERVDIAPGGDPRVVSDGKRAFAILIGDRTRGEQALLLDLLERRTTPIELAARDLPYGKNWQPFLSGGRLFVVHELTPFRILHIDPATGRAETAREVDVSFKLPAFGQSYAMLRGGANALVQDGDILGIGHATSQRFRHHPFFWRLSESGGFEVLLTDFFYAFQRRGYNILDPTSLFQHGTDVFLGLCCTERDWAHTQLVTNLLLRFRGRGGIAWGRPLSDWLAERPLTEDRGVANLDRHMFFCSEMPSATASQHELGGRISTGAQGHLVHGPYVSIQAEAHFRAQLSYLTKGGGSEQAGAFDVTAGRLDDKGTLTDFRILGQVVLPATRGNMREARVEFDTTGLRGMLLETRVYVNEGVIMNAFHIRTARHRDNCASAPSA